MAVDFNEIKRLIEERNSFLDANPKYKLMQEEIDKILRDIGPDHYKRQSTLQKMMLDSWYRVIEEWSKV